MIKPEYKYSEITERIIGCAMRVHSKMGNGYREVIYQRCLALEFEKEGLSFEREFEISVYYGENIVGKRRVDFLVQNVISVELKAVVELDNENLNQALNYLEAYRKEVGLLINFGAKKFQFKRLINSKL
ncbi:MAG: GxxExxY protein [Chitinophagaceae bacterium]|nr:GxxExxY protein [Chitinophagaceae bacterium]